MSDSVNSAERRDDLKRLLQAKKSELLTELRKALEEQRSENARLSFEIAQDDGDKSVEEHERHVQSAVHSMLSEQLDDIEHALVKLDEGSYGVCEECGGEIPVQRLRIQPFAAFCVSCQGEIERAGRRDTLWNKSSGSSGEDVYDYLPEE